MSAITPYLWFSTDAEEAVTFYVSVFPRSRICHVNHYSENGPGSPGLAMTIDFELHGQRFMALNGMNAADAPDALHRGAIALLVDCDTQAEVDALWDALAEGGAKMPCGWVRDKYGFAWNIVPAGLSDYLGGDDEEGAERAMKAMLGMQKLDLDALRRAYEGAGPG